MEKHIYRLSSGSHDEQGRRETMEDTHVNFDDVKVVFTNPFSKVSFYGVYDGHGGKTTANIIQEILHNKVFSSEEFSRGQVPDSLIQGFQDADSVVVTKANEEGWMNGTTAVVALVIDGVLYVGNIGDSEACLVSVRDGDVAEVDNLTTPHKANEPSEKKRIEELGGHVFFGRVFGALAVSRSFGDSRFKQPKTSKNFVTAFPAIKEIALAPEHKYLILACDGLWDVCSHREAATFVHQEFNAGKTPDEVSKALVNLALDRRTEDNVTVVVVKIDWEVSSGANTEAANEC
eukprot:TRINITY_DN3066_c0_g1_i10.p1 TRINITY_DN3066_c0_g1~~TRINITY_DN3066_c0_g1_i10.p1  ORF type:complete len:290 (-),score=43.47 TRINITY_DN3066_c0_g1_i10:374-1243(-)